jgi:SAM-dependent methyltransferase
MRTPGDISPISRDIRVLALKAMSNLPTSDSAYSIAKSRTIRPIDYMRYAEFEAILRGLEIRPQMEILDVSSPQWFSLYLAQSYPEATFHYINITDIELDPFEKIANALAIRNLKSQRADVRELPYDQDAFDKVISISVIEHIYPEEDGDLRALREIKRVLKPEGELLLTIAYKGKKSIVYMDRPVYERSEKKRNFYAREYDKEMFDKLIEHSGFSVRDSWFICERQGIFSPDYYEWGPGKDVWFARYLIKSRRLLERLLGKSLDEELAKHYLSVSREITNRVVNISAVLVKA